MIVNGDSQENLKKIYDTYLSKLKEVKDSVAIVKSFSDNILIVYPEVSEGALGNSFFITLADFQSELLRHGIIVRGAITIGDIHIGEDIIFGNGLVEAYKLENEKAIVPRIILSDSVLSLCRHYHKSYGEDSPFTRVLLKDADGITFLNYLHNPYLGGSEYNNVVGSYLKEHKRLIEDRLTEFSSNLRIFSKYVWLGNYHNTFCAHNGFNSDIPLASLSQKIGKVKFL